MNKTILIFGIVVLLVGMSVVPFTRGLSIEKIISTETQHWEYGSGDDNRAKAPITTMLIPPETGVICGIITDAFSKEPIENAWVRLIWETQYINLTFTNDSGFYHMNSPAGWISLMVDADGYRWEFPFHCLVEENGTTWENISLIPFPPFNSVVCGYITDEMTQEPIKNVYCRFRWVYYGFICHLYTQSNSNGFYKFKAPATEFGLGFEKYGYYNYFVGWKNVKENETKWVNVSMYPYPPENSIVCGYVTTAGTHEPVEKAEIYIVWYGEHGDLEYWTMTNNQGFYSQNIAEGEIIVYARKDGRMIKSPHVIVDENETVWVNLSLGRSRNRIVTNSLFLQFLERYPLLERFLTLLIK